MGTWNTFEVFLLPRCTMLWLLSMKTSWEMELTFQMNYESHQSSFGCSVHVCVLSCFSPVWIFATPWTVGFQAPLFFQARILEWVAMPSSRGSSWPRDRTHVSYASCIGRKVLYHQHHPGSLCCLCCSPFLMCLEFLSPGLFHISALQLAWHLFSLLSVLFEKYFCSESTILGFGKHESLF